MSATITLATKTGKSVILTKIAGGVSVDVPAANISRLNVVGHEMGLQSCIGAKIIIALDGDELARCSKWMADRHAETLALLAERGAHQQRYDAIEQAR